MRKSPWHVQVWSVIRLSWAPRSLPQVAMGTSTWLAALAWTLAMVLGVNVLIGVPIAYLSEPWGTMDRYADDLVPAIQETTFVMCVLIIGPLAAMTLLSRLDQRRDDPPIVGALLAPVTLIVPVLLWGSCNIIATIGREVRSDPRVPDWFDVPIFPLLGSCWIWPLIPIALVIMTAWGFRATASRMSRPATNCPRCGYPRQGIESTECPECGTPFDIDQRQASDAEWCHLGVTSDSDL